MRRGPKRSAKAAARSWWECPEVDEKKHNLSSLCLLRLGSLLPSSSAGVKYRYVNICSSLHITRLLNDNH